MTIMKFIHVECDCGWSDQVDDSSHEFEKYYDMENEEPCPRCKERLAEAV